jgi:hypothetical protein
VIRRVPPEDRDALLAAAADRLPGGVIDYVRLNIRARRA